MTKIPHLTSVTLCASLLVACGQPSSPLTVTMPAVAVDALSIAPVVQRAALAQGIYELAYSGRQSTLFVAATGDRGNKVQPPRILLLDPATLAQRGEIRLPHPGFGLALDEAAGRLYVGHHFEGAVSVIDLASKQVIRTVLLSAKVTHEEGKEKSEHYFRQLLVDAPRQRLYLPGFGEDDGALYIVNTATLELEHKVPDFGRGAIGIALDTARARLFVSNLEGEVIVFDTRNQRIVQRWPLGAEQPLNLAYDARHNHLLAVDQGHPFLSEYQQRTIPGFQSRQPGHRVVVRNADTGAAVAELPANGPITLRLDEARGRLFVTNRIDGTVTVFDNGDHRLLHTIELPSHPNSLALDEQTGAVFVSVKNGEQEAAGTDESVVRLDLQD